MGTQKRYFAQHRNGVCLSVSGRQNPSTVVATSNISHSINKTTGYSGGGRDMSMGVTPKTTLDSKG
jgi:hypothetical protein